MTQQVDTQRRSFWTFDKSLCMLFLLWVFLLGCTRMRSTDIWTHVRTGQLILERGHVPWVDWYSFTNFDRPWIDLHWLFQVQVAVLYEWGGVRLLVLTKALCLAATAAIGWWASGCGLPAWARAGCWVMPVLCLSGRALVRPEMMTLVFLAIWLFVIFRVDRKPRLIWWLPVVQLAWTNCHGLFVLGQVVGAAYFLDRVVRHFSTRSEPKGGGDRLPFRHLVVAAVLSLLASFVNPYVEEGATYPFRLYGELADWGPTENEPPIKFIRQYGFGNLFLLAELGTWMATVGSFIWLACEKRCELMRLLLFVAFSYLAWQAQRNTNIFSLVAGVILCANCAQAMQRRSERLTDLRRQTASRVKHKPAVCETDSGSRWTQVFCGVFSIWSVCVVTNSWAWFHGEGVDFGIDEKEAYYIHGAAEFAGQDGFPKRAFVAQFGQTAVYIFHNAPDCKVFLDGRLDVISPKTQAEYFRILDAIVEHKSRAWEERLRDGQGNLPVIILDSRFSRTVINWLHRTSGWRLVFADSAAAVFVDDTVADRLKLQVADARPLWNPP